MLALRVRAGNVEHNLELKQLGTGGHRVGPLARMRRDSRAAGPGLERLLGLPLRHHEVAVITLDRPQQLKPQEAWLLVDRMSAVGEAFLQLRAGTGGHLDCVDLHHRHVGQVTGQDETVNSAPLTHRGGAGRPLVLVHGLMGRGSTWSRQVPWLTRFGAVHTYDAPWHRGRADGESRADDPGQVSTERFVAELGAAVQTLGQPAVLVGHSMGALHSWCLAAQHPELVSAVVIEDMAPDFVGRTVGSWEPWLHALPAEFDSAEAIFAEFGPIAGRYFLEAFDRTATGWRLHGRPERWIAIAGEWGTRDYWVQWQAVRTPVLLIEAEDSVTPPGQMQRMRELASGPVTYLRVPGAGHLIHDDAPEAYQRAVEEFLSGL